MPAWCCCWRRTPEGKEHLSDAESAASDDGGTDDGSCSARDPVVLKYAKTTIDDRSEEADAISFASSLDLVDPEALRVPLM